MGLTLRYLDSSVVLDAIDPASARHASIDAALRSLPPTDFAVSDLVRMECSVQALRAKDHVRLADLQALFVSIVVFPLPPLVFEHAATLRATHLSFKTPDALHYGCQEFWTNDLDLVKRAVGLAFRTF